MNYFLLYLITGALLYPAAMDMWYRISYKRQEFYNPSQVNWYLGFVVLATTYPITFPHLLYNYFKEMKS